MTLTKCWPGGKTRAFNLTYDDGVVQDIGMVELLNELGLKGTFNLNSQLMAEDFRWQHPCGMWVCRLGPEQAAALYEGHEVACHTLTHPDFSALSREAMLWEMGEDKRRLEALFGREIRGFALPFHHWSNLARSCAIECGFSYARISEESGAYRPPEDYYSWKAGIFHLNEGLDDYVEGFLQCENEMALGQIVGHSYDLDAIGDWETMAGHLRRISEDSDTVSMTNLELADYLRAMEQAVLSDGRLENRSSLPLWFRLNTERICLLPGESRQL
ncbi:MAG: polysaccharide deacetylase family protein [Oscillospiraceae bacterium]|nr:polysaccharide deacetylase family protein [Oscillospiraceae bacterium]